MKMTQRLRGKVSVVTGASRGVGKGIALGLGEAGATVYVTGRTETEEKATVPLPGTIHLVSAELAEEYSFDDIDGKRPTSLRPFPEKWG